MMSDKLNLSTVLVSYNTAHLIPKVLKKLEAATKNVHSQVIIIDNKSSDDSISVLAQHGQHCTVLLNDKNVGFGRANNQSLSLITGDYILLLNTDAFIEPNAIELSLNFMEANSACGILGVRLVDGQNQPQSSVRFFPTPWTLFLNKSQLTNVIRDKRVTTELNFDYPGPMECDWVPGCYYLIRRQVITDVGLFDPRFFLYFEEVDHCKAAKQAGWKVMCLPTTTVVHLGGESAKSTGPLNQGNRQILAIELESELMYFRKNHGLAYVLLDVFLNYCAMAIHSAKRIIRWQRPFQIFGGLGYLAVLNRAIRSTQFGRRSPR